jgi:hypothetical protein
MMEIMEGDILNEDFLWYDKSSKYTSTVTSHTAELYSCSCKEFSRLFGKVIPLFKPLLDMRTKFLDERFEQLKLQTEFNIRNYTTSAN